MAKNIQQINMVTRETSEVKSIKKMNLVRDNKCDFDNKTGYTLEPVCNRWTCFYLISIVENKRMNV